MLIKALKNFEKWPQIKEDSEKERIRNSLYIEAESYYVACSEMNEKQLTVLDNQVQTNLNMTSEADNQFNSWLFYRTSLLPRFEELLDGLERFRFQRTIKMF